jgi:predicted outer membrane protein
MSAPVTRSRRILVSTAVAGAIAGAILSTPAWAAAPARPFAHEEVQITSGDGAVAGGLTPGDVDLLVRVRLAGLWEIPAGRMAVEKGESRRVREIGKEIAQQHGELDKVVVKAAARLGVALPDQPNADQQAWLNEMEAATGRAFDEVFVYRLRVAHGKVFQTVAAVRATTRNDVVREVATAGNAFVLNHMTLLESTGLVRYDDLPPPPYPAADPVWFVGRAPGLAAAVVWVLLAAAAAVVVVNLARMASPRLAGDRAPTRGLRRRAADRRAQPAPPSPRDPPSGGIVLAPVGAGRDPLPMRRRRP